MSRFGAYRRRVRDLWPFDRDDALKVFAVLVASALALWIAAVLGAAVWVFLAMSGLR